MEKVMLPRLLVIGGSGFIGRHVVSRGVKLGWQVTSLGLHVQEISRLTPGATHVVADLTQADSLRQLGPNQFDYIVNIGGYIDHALFFRGGRRLIHTHFDGLLNLLEFLDRNCVKRFIQIGSSDEYGEAPGPQHEGMRELPISPYSLAKVASTHFLQMLHRTESFPAVTLRLFLTYGPGQDAKRFLPQIIKGCLQDVEFPTSDGAQLRDFCYVDDTVNAIFLAFESDLANGEIFNVGSGMPVTIRELIERVCAAVGKGRPKFGLIQHRPNENMALYANNQKIQNQLGWKPEVSLQVGLQRTIESMKVIYA
ncbi:MAG: NAD(P)-dependent oxidoreductase [Glaciimonas sp.]|nr:NAD(P)-dependent oxidoreductase [Glaciimonas sp.]